MKTPKEDRFKDHGHVGKTFGEPFDANAPITCQKCIDELNVSMLGWLDTLTERHNLPPNFWDGYKFSWEK